MTINTKELCDNFIDNVEYATNGHAHLMHIDLAVFYVQSVFKTLAPYFNKLEEDILALQKETKHRNHTVNTVLDTFGAEIERLEKLIKEKTNHDNK